MEKVSANCVSHPGHPGLPGLSPRLTICRDIYSKLDTTMITRVGDCGWWQVATGDWMAMRYSISNIINNRNDFHDHELRQFAWSRGSHCSARLTTHHFSRRQVIQCWIFPIDLLMSCWKYFEIQYVRKISLFRKSPNQQDFEPHDARFICSNNSSYRN